MSKKHRKYQRPKQPETDGPKLAATPSAAEPAEVAPVETPGDQMDTLRQRAAERDEFLDKLQHLKAEYSNYQRRVLRDQEELHKFASQDLITDLLPVLDNLDRALEASGNDAGDLLAGVRMVRTQMIRVLARYGVEELDCAGRPFDPNFHEAVMQLASADHPPGTVLNEVEKGYTYNGRVIRPSKVVVNAASTPSVGTSEDPPARDSTDDGSGADV